MGYTAIQGAVIDFLNEDQFENRRLSGILLSNSF